MVKADVLAFLLDLGVKAFTLSPWSTMFIVGFSDMAFIYFYCVSGTVLMVVFELLKVFVTKKL